jgi:hypothetical protein
MKKIQRALLGLVICLSASCDSTSIPECYENVIEIKNEQQDTVRFYVFNNLTKALDCAKKSNKNILAVFSGPKSQSISNIEWKSLSADNLRGIINEHYVTVWFRIDDLTPLSDTTLVNHLIGKKVRTVGDRNFYLQTALTYTNTSPVYAIINSELECIDKSGIEQTEDLVRFFKKNRKQKITSFAKPTS